MKKYLDTVHGLLRFSIAGRIRRRNSNDSRHALRSLASYYMKTNTETTIETGATGNTALETSIAMMKMTARTWKLDAEKASGILINFAWVNSQTRADIVARLYEGIKDVETKGSESAAFIITGDKGSVFRAGEITADGKAFRVMKHSGGLTGWAMLAAFEGSGLSIKRATMESIVAKCKVARKVVKRNTGISYDILCDGAAKSDSLYYGSIRLVNGRALLWHEEHKANATNAHEISAIAKDGMDVSAMRETVGAANGMIVKRKVSARKVKSEASAEKTVTEETAG